MLLLLIIAGHADQLTVRTGKVLTIALDSNPTTGYSWKLAAPPDKRMIVFIGSKYISGRPGMVGAGGSEIWKFKALKKGKTRLTLKYARPWEKGVKPVNVKNYNVIIVR